MAHYRLISFYHNFNAFFFTINPTLFRFYSDNFSRIIYNSINANDLKEKDYGEVRGRGGGLKKGKRTEKKSLCMLTPRPHALLPNQRKLSLKYIKRDSRSTVLTCLFLSTPEIFFRFFFSFFYVIIIIFFLSANDCH